MLTLPKNWCIYNSLQLGPHLSCRLFKHSPACISEAFNSPCIIRSDFFFATFGMSCPRKSDLGRTPTINLFEQCSKPLWHSMKYCLASNWILFFWLLIFHPYINWVHPWKRTAGTWDFHLFFSKENSTSIHLHCWGSIRWFLGSSKITLFLTTNQGFYPPWK